MNSLNNDISDASLIKSLCQHNKRHIKEIDRLQTVNEELEEYVAELKNKLDKLENIEEIFDTFEDNTQYTDKERIAVIKNLDYIINLKEQHKILRNKYVKMKKDYTRVLREIVDLNMKLLGKKED